MRFSGARAYELEERLVTRYPHRHSGSAAAQGAAAWLREIASHNGNGTRCRHDSFAVVNYSRPLVLHNVVCELPGAAPEAILVLAHHDQSPQTVEGADDGGSGVAVLLQLLEIFAREAPPRYTLVFVSTDGAEYGALGARRYLQQTPRRIVAALALEGLGKKWSAGLELSAAGQFRGYGPLWLQLAAQAAARAAGEPWVPRILPLSRQLWEQAVPLSFTGQGPLVAAGVPALGLSSAYPADRATRERVWETYHSPADRLEHQAPEVLEHAGRAAEALLRQLLAMERLPAESGPYLYFRRAGTGRVLRAAPLHALLVALVVLFLGAGLRRARAGVRAALPSFLALFLPLFGSVLLLYGLTAIDLLDSYHLYPAAVRDPALVQPKWLGVAYFLGGLGTFLAAGRQFTRRPPAPGLAQRRGLAFLVLGLCAALVLLMNPLSLLLLVPAASWLLVSGRRALDIPLFLLGTAPLCALLYYLGSVVLHIGPYVLWYLLLMLSSGMIPLPAAALGTAVLAAGLSLVVPPAARC